MRKIATLSSVSVSVLALTLGLPACQQAGDVPEEVLETQSLALVAQQPNTVLILEPTVLGGLQSQEATMAMQSGFNVELTSAADWLARTTAQFATYEALILGDGGCGFLGNVAAAEANSAVWGAAAGGNVIIFGSDPSSHISNGSGLFTRDAIRFAADGATTGAYISLSCYYFNAAPGTPVPVLDGFGTFTVRQPATAYNDAHQVAIHPTMTLVSDASLSNWHPSARELIESFPPTFQPHVIVEDVIEPGALSFPDLSTGIPYIVSRGAQPSLCGNGTLDPGEQCDDGNYASWDGCSEKCVVEPWICGNGTLEPGEQCDDGNTTSGDGCSGTCQIEAGASIGACCLVGGGCQEALTPGDCELIGAYTADDLTCSDVEPECAGLLGACCLAAGGCADSMTDTLCQQGGGTFLNYGTSCAGDGQVCPPPVPGTGACCLPNGTCADGTDIAKCEINGGAYLGDNTTCLTQGALCETPEVGACCLEGSCLETTPVKCELLGGLYAGNGTPCDEETCPGCTDDPMGACCVDGECLMLTADACYLNGGLYAGDGSVCTSGICDCDNGCCDELAASCSWTALDPSGGGLPLGFALSAALALGTAARRRSRKSPRLD